ncbi:MAG: selenium cofactor biosynthesis protein YqeC [bacterium]
MHFHHLIASDIDKLKGQVVSVIGGGGKSSFLNQVACELRGQDVKLLISTTTKFQYIPEIALVMQNENPDYLQQIEKILREKQEVQLAKDYYKSDSKAGKLSGVDSNEFAALRKLADLILLEADGCRQRAIKTHKAFEPVIPESTTSVVIICGVNVVGKPLHEDHVHRAELFSRKWNLPLGTTLTPTIIANELLSPESYLRFVPRAASVAILLNKADLDQKGGRQLAAELKRRCQYPIYLGSIAKNFLTRIA